MKEQKCEHCGYALVALVVCAACRREVEALSNEVMILLAGGLLLAGYLIGYTVNIKW